MLSACWQTFDHPDPHGHTLTLLRNYLHGLKQPERQSQAGKQLRSRHALRWTDANKSERDCECVGKKKRNAVQDEIDAVLARQERRKHNVLRVRRAQRAYASMQQLAKQLQQPQRQS